METTTTATANQIKQDDGSVLVPCGCGERENLQTSWYEADPDNSDGSELRVYISCGECGSCGPEVETNNESTRPLGDAELAARMAWNETRRICAEDARLVPEVKALVDYLQHQLEMAQAGASPALESEVVQALLKPLLPDAVTTAVIPLTTW